MERLTTCKEITKDTDMTKQWGYSHIYKKLAEYEELEEQNRLIKLPCAVGNLLYRVVGDEIIEECVKDIQFVATGNWSLYKDFGKTVFITQAEAEQALGGI